MRDLLQTLQFPQGFFCLSLCSVRIHATSRHPSLKIARDMSFKGDCLLLDRHNATENGLACNFRIKFIATFDQRTMNKPVAVFFKDSSEEIVGRFGLGQLAK